MYREFKPIAPLRPFVQCIWTMKARGEDFAEPQRLVPDGNIEVMLHYGDSSSQAWTSGSKNIDIHKGSCLVGQRPGYYFTSASGDVDFIGISFKPGGLSPFIHQPVEDLTGSIIPLKLLNNALFLEIEERIVELQDIASRIELIESLLTKNLQANRDRLENVERFIPLVHTISNYSSVAHFLREHIIHERKLQRDFDHHVGLTPKFLQRVLRFREAAHAMFTASFKNLTALAYDCGYYDQAHFINEFKYFSGVSPRQYLQECGKDLSPAWMEE
jgi:AraC-like DNA-binding protein